MGVLGWEVGKLRLVLHGGAAAAEAMEKQSLRDDYQTSCSRLTMTRFTWERLKTIKKHCRALGAAVGDYGVQVVFFVNPPS